MKDGIQLSMAAKASGAVTGGKVNRKAIAVILLGLPWTLGGCNKMAAHTSGKATAVTPRRFLGALLAAI